MILKTQIKTISTFSVKKVRKLRKIFGKRLARLLQSLRPTTGYSDLRRRLNRA